MQIQFQALTQAMVDTLATVDAEQSAITRAYANAAIIPNAQIRAIVEQETQQLVGVVVEGTAIADGRWWLYDLIIDPRLRRQGYGRATIAALLAERAANYSIQQLHAAYPNSNQLAQQFWAALGAQIAQSDATGVVTVALALPPRPMPSATITLQSITLANARACLALSVAPHQQQFVASTAASLVQSRFEPHWETHGIYADETLVGFMMYGNDPDYGWGLLRLLVDAKFQGRGYGRTAVQHMLATIRAAGGSSVAVSYEDANDVARRLYQSLGFVETDEQPFGEPFAILQLNQ
ncbi:GNAT family N-acetyltransferase [Herpetosiphon giganteus]|uniref:GNAT family N-acetyltransferase n=1 Tax=Herpetosiphon giganteus TaxID=2029754 RepID=UPI00195B7192|nr:GNAT family N-acetyltransferase [Herpetosiphon giganteus]MBM7844632.1 ribosomal protein S18 acetylase RimI-like enzyme [Herpetosiphon giganteus]